MKKRKKNISVPGEPFHRSSRSLSLCMIVRNEEEDLPLCLNSVKSAVDEIVIVDTGSTDNTKEVSRRLEARVFDFAWVDDFSAARNQSILRAKGDYILWLDADDRVDPSDVEKLRLLKQNFPWKKNRAYYVRVNSQSPVDGDTHFYQVRIFPNVAGAGFEGRVHEQVYYRLKQLGVEFVQTDIMVRHVGYHDEKTVIQKSERNLEIVYRELEENPGNLVLHYNAARTLGGIGRQAEAVGHMKKILENGRIREKERDFFLQAGILAGKYYTDLEAYDQAGTIFQDLSHEFPENGFVRYGLGENFFQKKDYWRAIEELKKSLQFPVKVGLFPINLGKLRYYQYYLLGQCYLETGQAESAREMFLKSLNLHRDHHLSFQSLGLLALQGGKFGEAVEYHKKAIQAGGGSDCNYANLGLALKKLGQDGEAKEAFLHSIKMNPRRTEALVNLGHLFKKEENYQKALEYFEKALQLGSPPADIRLALSDLYFRLQDLDELVEQCDSLLADLGLPRNFIINNFKDLNSLYGMIGDELKKMGRTDLSLAAYQVSFLISPSQEVLEKMVPLANSSGILKSCLEEINEILRFHGQEVPEKKSRPPFLSPV